MMALLAILLVQECRNMSSKSSLHQESISDRMLPSHSHSNKPRGKKGKEKWKESACKFSAIQKDRLETER